MEKTVAAIDVGYGYTKSAIGTSRKAFKCNVFPSQAPVANNLAMAEALGSSLRIVQIPIQGLPYAVGPEVGMATGAIAVRNTDNICSESDEYLGCTPNQWWVGCITNTQSRQRSCDRTLADHNRSTITRRDQGASA